MGFETRSLTAPEEFGEHLESLRPLVVVLDLMMPSCDGVQLLRKMKEVACDAHVLIMSGMDARELSVAQNLGRSYGLKVLGTLQKPIKLPIVKEHLRNVIGAAKAFTANDLKQALARAELVVHFQPQVTCATGVCTVDGAEALVRWQHPEFGLLMPGDFLPVIEASGLTTELTDYVLEASLRQLADWQDRGLNIGVSVNMSAGFFQDLSFPDRLKTLLTEYQVAGEKLTLELTESTAMSDVPSVMDIFLRVRMSRVRLSIDDFGSGYSSLKRLYQLPFDELKIDRTFVSGLPGDEEAQTIVRATIGLAHAMNLKVCAEGVETQVAFDFLAALGCDRAQGFLISPATTPAEVEALCNKVQSIKGRSSQVFRL
jgi:EAL domain-containing protein (putative c-di-GMP-specific phosphodiesterase class I)